MGGKPRVPDIVEFEDTLQYRYRAGSRTQAAQTEDTLGEELFLGTCWPTGQATVGAGDAVRRASTILTVGAHRRWDVAGLSGFRGSRGAGAHIQTLSQATFIFS